MSTDYISRPDSLTKLIVARIMLWLSLALSLLVTIQEHTGIVCKIRKIVFRENVMNNMK